MKYIYKPLVLVCMVLQFVSNAQNEAIKWYFGINAGLDFASSPPTILTNGALVTNEGCATISDPSGNLLFYTDGSTVWNASHVPMANGTGLFGNASTTQAALIVRQPGSSIIYHIFTLGSGGSASLCYSTVDISLASGSGSVITKNNLLANSMTEKLTGAKHCNGIDYWAITHEGNTNNFKAFLVTSAGVSVTPVVSATGTTNVGGLGTMKSSPNGKMLASSRNIPSGTIAGDVFDFDQTSGQVTFKYSLSTGLGSYGCEFSPDGNKLYIAGYSGANYNLAQFDLCAGSETAVAASMYTMSCTSLIGAMQVAPNGKVYCARTGKQDLGVINSPNASGALCNFVELGQSIAPKSCQLGLPNFAIAYTPTLAPFTYTLTGCQTASFNAPPIVQTSTVTGCTPSGYSVTGVQWNFGDPISGGANTSILLNPQHTYTSAGTYTTTFIVNFSCGGGNDTLRQVVTIANSAPSLSVAGNFTVCKGDKRTYTVSGANTYSWSNNATTPTVSLTHTVTKSYTVTGTNTTTSCSGKKIFTVTVNPCTAIDELYEATGQINIYPNPANNVLYIENPVKTRILLLNHQGQLLKEEVFESGHNSIDISTYEDGVYFLRTINNAGATSRRIVKAN